MLPQNARILGEHVNSITLRSRLLVKRCVDQVQMKLARVEIPGPNQDREIGSDQSPK